MKFKYAQFTFVGAVALILSFFIWHVIHSEEDSENKASNAPGLELPPSSAGQHEVDSTRPERLKRQRSIPEKKRFYENIGPFSVPLEMDEKQVMHRVKAGLKRLEKGTLPTEDKPMPNLREAYGRLVRDEIFMDNNFPVWGIECEEYFVFSGHRGCDPQLVFQYGFAVRKDDGRIFKWVLDDVE